MMKLSQESRREIARAEVRKRQVEKEQKKQLKSRYPTLRQMTKSSAADLSKKLAFIFEKLSENIVEDMSLKELIEKDAGWLRKLLLGGGLFGAGVWVGKGYRQHGIYTPRELRMPMDEGVMEY